MNKTLNSHTIIENYFKKKGWKPFDFQYDVWEKYNDGYSGIIHSSTGTGKTFAIWFACVIEYLKDTKKSKNEPLTILWITPLRALAKDTFQTLKQSIDDLELNWTIGLRTGDVSQKEKKQHRTNPPTVLIITPESLSLLLSYSESYHIFNNLKCVVVDEWHELLSSKRGVMVELCLARLRRFTPNIKVWGMSATLGNLEMAMDTLLPDKSKKRILVNGTVQKSTIIDSVLPLDIERFPRAGHLGLKLLPEVVRIIEESNSCLIFTNTRSQTEIWYNELLEYEPMLSGQIALHHGSLESDLRLYVEDALKQGTIKAVVCTSSLDLGVDFSPVDRVVQIGSIKGIARFMQRAGRSGHSPGAVSRITFVPTNALELIELAAVRKSIQKSIIEPREPIIKPFDLLAQHILTLSCSGYLNDCETYIEVRSAFSFKDLSLSEWDEVIRFINSGGDSLKGYSEYSKIKYDNDEFTIKDKAIERRHRMSIGVISSDTMLKVKYLKGGYIGSIEENFIAKLKIGDTFIFAGKALKYEKIKDLTVLVTKSDINEGQIPQWMGGRMQLSSELATAFKLVLSDVIQNDFWCEELVAIKPILDLQQKWSIIPTMNQFLIEKLHYKSKHNLYFYTFEGYLINQVLSSLIAHRISQEMPISFSIAVNDYGFELYSDQEVEIEKLVQNKLLSIEITDDEINQAINSTEISKRQFREIARISGLIFNGYPGASKTVKQVQASSGLIFDVYAKYEPQHILMRQAHTEAMNNIDIKRITKILEKLKKSEIKIVELSFPSPFAFPLLADRLRAKLSSEKLSVRLEKMMIELEKKAG